MADGTRCNSWAAALKLPWRATASTTSREYSDHMAAAFKLIDRSVQLLSLHSEIVRWQDLQGFNEKFFWFHLVPGGAEHARLSRHGHVLAGVRRHGRAITHRRGRSGRQLEYFPRRLCRGAVVVGAAV